MDPVSVLSVCCLNCCQDPLVSRSVIGKVSFPILLRQREKRFHRSETASISSLHRSETVAIWWRGVAIWAAVEVVYGGGQRLIGEGGGVGLRRGSRRHRCASTTSSSTAMHPPRRRILHGSASTMAQYQRWHRPQRGVASSTAQHRGWREICTSVSPVSFPSARDLHGEGVSSYRRSTFLLPMAWIGSLDDIFEVSLCVLIWMLVVVR
jgi:hypothetical protein